MSCGTRAQHFLPGDPDGARLLRSSLLVNYSPTETANCWWPRTAPLFGSQPRRPSCVCSGLEPHCRTSRYARPQPTPSPGYCSLTSLLGTANLHLPVLPLRYCSWRPLITAGHPVRSSVPSPSCNRSGFGTPPPHRPANYNCVQLPGSSSLPGSLDLGYKRNHNHTATQCLLQPAQISARSKMK